MKIPPTAATEKTQKFHEHETKQIEHDDAGVDELHHWLLHDLALSDTTARAQEDHRRRERELEMLMP